MRTEKFIQSLLDKKKLPGITVLVGKRNKVLFSKAFGYNSVLADKRLLTTEAIYDTASLTKPLITSFLIVYLIEKGELKPDTQIKTFFSGFSPEITIAHLLTHTSGLPPWFPFYLFSHQDFITQLSQLPLISKPGKSVNYSCPGYILLYHIIEKISANKFIDLAKKIIIDNLKLKNTFLKVPDLKKPFTVPTENGNCYEKKLAEKKFKNEADTYNWRKNLICGDTHDVNSFYLGGTAGNSGLFADIKDLFTLSAEFHISTANIIHPDSIKLFWTNFTPYKKSHRSFGFKLNSSIITSGGNSISRKAIGHSGFTGTSIWLEPDTGLTFIILSNRIHPKVDGKTNFNRIRRKIHKKLKQDLGL